MKFENQFFQTFQNSENIFLSAVKPTPVIQPKIIGWSTDCAKLLRVSQTDEMTALLCGNESSPKIQSYSARYGGHQFGHWAGQLGDGRAITLGELNNYEVQLKGAGLTPYSRQGDGRAVLRSSLREFICSEAMHALGVPTTRALSLAVTGEKVIRDILYDGNPQPETGAIVTRVSPSFIRFGNFQILAVNQQYDELKKLADYVIQNFYPEILQEPKTDLQKYAEFLKQISIRTARMMAHWMSLGFVHGVMNTDNMSILGLTIDYGPYGWEEEFDPDFTPNTTDFSHRRYRFSHQPQIALWNLNALANALFTLMPDKDIVMESLSHYQKTYETTYWEKLSRKLGLNLSPTEENSKFLTDLFELLQNGKTDYTLFFRTLADEKMSENFLAQVKRISYATDFSPRLETGWMSWLKEYSYRLQLQALPDAMRVMKSVNPSIIFRNYLAQEAIDLADRGDYSRIEKYLKEFSEPFKDRDLQNDPLTFKRPSWADHKPGCSILSCSS